MKVIDISAWQENIDWEAVKSAGIKGVIIKLGEGTNLDDMFFDHINNAVNNGLKYGLYYYGHAKNEAEARREAYTVDQWIKTYIRGENPPLGIWYDAEDKDMLQGDENVVYPIANFVHTLREAGYNYVGVYTSYNWLTNVIDLQPLPLDIPIWVAQYNTRNDFYFENPNRICRMWQYTDKELIGKYELMKVDCNVYYD